MNRLLLLGMFTTVLTLSQVKNYYFPLMFFIFINIHFSHVYAVDFIESGPPFVKIDNISSEKLTDVSALIRDAQGFIWLVNSKGLLRFDGYKFKLFPGLEQFTSPNVDDVVEGQFGRLWIATKDKGLVKFDTLSATLTFYDISETFAIEEYGTVAQIDKLIYQNQYLYLVSKNTVIKVDENTLLVTERFHFPIADNARIVRLLVTTEGDIWTAANPGNGVIRYNKEGYTHFEHQPSNNNSISSSFVTSIYQDSQKRIWFGGIAGLDLFEPTSQSFKHFSPLDFSKKTHKNTGALANFVLTIVEDNEAALWLGLVNNGVVKFLPDSNVFEHYPHLKGIASTIASDNMFDGVSIDNQQALWVSTNRGLSQLPLNNRKVSQWINIDRDTCKADALYGKNQKLLFACDKSLFQLDQKQIRLLHHFNEKIVSIYQEAEHFIWLGTRGGGAYRYNVVQDTTEHYGFSSSVNDQTGVNFAHHLRADVSGNLYGLTAAHTIQKGSGLIRFNTHENKFENFATELALGNWVDINERKMILIASYSPAEEQLYWFDKAEQRIDKMPIKTGHVLASIKWRQQLWVSTEKLGLIVIDISTGEWKKITNRINGDVNGFHLDKSAQNLYLTANNQLLRLTSIINNSIEADCITCSLVLDDLNVNESQKGQIIKGNTLLTDNNNLIISNENRLLTISINELENKVHNSQLLLTDFSVEGKPVFGTKVNKGELLQQSIEHVNQLVIPADTTFFSFGFAKVGANQPQRTEYAYKLEGLNKDWIYVNANNAQANYSLLPAGQYVFKAKASNDNGEWQEESATLSLDITVLPPWWKTWWAYCSYLGVIFFLFSLFYRTKIAEKERQATVELVKAKEQLFANISHEFRTPLTLILGPAKAIKSSNIDTDTQHNVGLIERNALRLLSMVEQLLLLAQLKHTSLTSSPSQQVSSICHFVMQTFDAIARDKNITLTLKSIIDDSWWVVGSQNALETILFNLMSNAIKYTDVGGCISLEVTVNDHWLEFKLTDTGNGIAEDDHGKIFERFTRLENNSEVQGIGIGLALVKELIIDLGGSIRVESQLGQGSCFIFTLARAKASRFTASGLKPKIEQQHLIPGQLRADSQTDVKESIQNPNDLSQKTDDNLSDHNSKPIILIVDDNVEIRAFIRSRLDRGYAIFEAENGQDALIQALEQSPDLIISDVMMPVMDGFELLTSIRNNAALSHIPIILLTSKDDQQSKLKGLSDLADDYITKPFDVQELALRVQRLLEIRTILQRRFTSADLPTPLNTNVMDLADTADKSDQSARFNSVEQLFVQRFKEQIKEGYNNPGLSLSMISNQLAMSDRQLQRKLKAISGSSFNEILREYRLTQGEKLLNSGEQIAVIADKVGFTSSSYFVRCFKAKYGTSPNDYRKTH